MKTRVLSLLLALGLLAVSLSAAPPLADRLPAGSLLYAGWAGVGDKLADSQLGQLAQEPGIRQAAGAIWKAMLSEVSRENRTIGELLEAHGGDLLSMSIALAVTKLEMSPRGPDVGVVIIADAKAQRQVIEKLLRAFLAQVGEGDLKETKTEAAHYWTAQDDVLIGFGFKGDLFFVSFGQDGLDKFLQTAPEKSLAASPAFQAAMKPVGGDDIQIAAYVDAASLLKKLLPPGDEEAGKIVKTLGVDGVTSLAGTVRIVGGQMLTRARLNSPAPHKGLLSFLAGPPLRETDLARVPADADFALAWRINPAAVLETIQAMVREIAGRDEVAAGLAEVQQETGVDVRTLLASLGDSLVLSSAASQGGFLTGTVFSAEIKDADAFKAQLDKIEEFMRREFAPRGDSAPRPGGRRRSGIQLLTAQAGPTQIRYVQIVDNDIIPVAPAWAVHQGRLYIALWPQALQDVLGRAGGEAPAASPAFAALRGKLSPKASIVSFVNTPQLLRRAYPLLLAGWTMGANVLPLEAPIKTLPQWLPPLPALQRHLTPQMNAVSADDNGLLFESYGPLPDPSALADVALLAGVAVFRSEARVVSEPMVMEGPGPADRPAERPADPPTRKAEFQAQAEMRQLLLALLTYAIDNKNRFPDSLGDDKLAKYLEGDLKEKLTSPPYTYLGKGQDVTGIREPSKYVMIYRTPPAGGNRVIVGFADGHVRAMPTAELEGMLEAQKK